MRDKLFIAEHRGGLLKKEQHHQMLNWAIKCTEHVLHLLKEPIDERLLHALLTGKNWLNGNVTVGEVRRGSLNAIAVANESINPTLIAIARAIGHAVATAHMADHSIIAALYALKAVKSSNQSVDEERKWQNEQLEPEIMELILTARDTIKKNLKNK